MPGLNVDVLNNPPTIAELQSAGVDAVRLVSQPDPNGDGVHPAIEQYLADCKAAGIFVLVVINGQSQGRLPANNQGWFQCRNEPDGQPPASEAMTPDQYVAEFNTYAETFPQFRWIAAGLCGSDPVGYWSAIAPQLVGCAGFAVHPYLKSPDDALALVQAMQAVTPDLAAFVTEFNCSAADLPAMLGKLYGSTWGQYWYAAGDWMNDGPTGNCTGYGLLDHPDKLAAWQQALANLKAPPPADELWVDLSNFQGPLTDQMVADMKASGVVGICSQAITGLNGKSYTRQQLQKALDSGLRIAGYAWCFGSTSVSGRLHLFDGFTLEWLALDVEDSGDSISSVDRDLQLCDAYTGKPTEFYTGRWFFQSKGWVTTRWSGRRLWDAIYDDIPDEDVDFVPFGGWSSCFTKQFWDKQVYGGVTCDVNFRRAA